METTVPRFPEARSRSEVLSRSVPGLQCVEGGSSDTFTDRLVPKFGSRDTHGDGSADVPDVHRYRVHSGNVWVPTLGRVGTGPKEERVEIFTESKILEEPSKYYFSSEDFGVYKNLLKFGVQRRPPTPYVLLPFKNSYFQCTYYALGR